MCLDEEGPWKCAAKRAGVWWKSGGQQPQGITSEQRTEMQKHLPSRFRRVCPLQQNQVDAGKMHQFGWYRERLRPIG